MLQTLPFALRFAQGCKAESKLLWNASLFSGRSAACSASEVQGSAAANEMKVAQYSSSEAAAMADKKRHINGMGGLTFGTSRPSIKGSFASSKSFSTSGAAVAAVEAPAKKSFFNKLAAAAAAVAAAVALAVAAPASADAPQPWQWGFQDSATSTAQAAQDLHHDVMFFVISITVLVLYMVFQLATKFHYSHQGALAEKITHHTTLEVIWTVLPTLIVLLIAVPSLTLIYSMDQHNDRPGLTVKIIGRQWYWSYEMHDHLQHKLVDPDRLVALAEKSLGV